MGNDFLNIRKGESKRQKDIKKASLFREAGTAYQSRTDDLLRERQMSWTTRRMRLVDVCMVFYAVENGCKSTNIFRYGKIFFSKNTYQSDFHWYFFCWRTPARVLIRHFFLSLAVNLGAITTFYPRSPPPLPVCPPGTCRKTQHQTCDNRWLPQVWRRTMRCPLAIRPVRP